MSWHFFPVLVNVFFLFVHNLFRDEICAFKFDRKPTQATAALGTHA